LTALAGPQDRHKALRAGYQLHLAKPLDASELTAAIAALIGRTDHD
jgi:CheY-like chemotaxis protein